MSGPVAGKDRRMVSEAEFVRLWTELSPEAEEAVCVALSCAPDAADGNSPLDVLTLVERVVDQPEMGGLVYGLTAQDVHDLVAGERHETVPVGILLKVASAEAAALSAVT